MIKKYIPCLLFLLLPFFVSGQNAPLSEDAKISILTIGPGTNLNDAFGHNAFRVQDQAIGLDKTYDYGRYNFETPNFYLKFAQGKLLYEVGSNNFQPFLNYYKRQDRWVKEQLLTLTSQEKKKLYAFLENNAKPENKKYKYDFFYDNCATRMRDVLQNVLGERLHFSDNHITESYTFRQLIQKNVHWNTWGSMGMDVAIGAVVDVPAKPLEYQFLPEYVYHGVANAEIITRDLRIPLLRENTVLYNASEKTQSPDYLTSPVFIFSLLALAILGFTIRDIQRGKRTRSIDGIIFSITGLIGIFLFLLWFATDHSATANNYNVLWAFLFNVFVVYAVTRKDPKPWVRKYVFFLILLMVLLIMHWATGVQNFAYALIPILIALVIRYAYLIRIIPAQK